MRTHQGRAWPAPEAQRARQAGAIGVVTYLSPLCGQECCLGGSTAVHACHSTCTEDEARIGLHSDGIASYAPNEWLVIWTLPPALQCVAYVYRLRQITGACTRCECLLSLSNGQSRVCAFLRDSRSWSVAGRLTSLTQRTTGNIEDIARDLCLPPRNPVTDRLHMSQR